MSSAEAPTGRQTIIGSAWMIGWRMVSRVLGLASTLLLARILVPADFGLVAMATAFSASVEALSQIGVLDALVRDGRTDRALYNTAFTLNAARGLLTALVIAAGAPIVSHFFGEPRLTPVLIVLSIGFASLGLENVGTIEFRREMAFGNQFLILLLPRTLQIAATVGFALTLQSYWALVAGMLTGRLASLVASYALHPFRPRLSLAAWRDIAGFSIWSWFAALARLVWNRMDAFIIGSTLGPARLGSYLVGSELALLPATELVAPVSEVLFPGFAKARARDAEALQTVPVVVLALTILTFPVAAAVSAGANDIIAVMLGPKWAEAQPVVSVLAWLCIVQPTSYVTWVYLVAIGHIRKDVEVIVLASMFKLPALMWAAQSGGVMGVAEAILAAGVVEASLFAWQLGRTIRLPIAAVAGPMLRVIAAALVTVAGLRATGLGWHAQSVSIVGGLAGGIGLGAVATALFWSTLLALWWAAGRPTGPERLLLQNGAVVLVPLVGRLRRRLSPS